MQEVGESLAGRIAILELENLSLQKLLIKNNNLVSELLKLVITRGQFQNFGAMKNFLLLYFILHI